MKTNVLHLRRVARPRPLPAAVERHDGTLVVDVPTVVSEQWLRDLAELLDGSDRTVTPPAGSLETGSVRMDFDRMHVTVAHRPLTLTRQEFLLLKLFLQNQGRVFSRGQLQRMAWNHDEWGPGRTVDVHVRRLRMKLGPESDRLVTVRGFGYRFDPPAGAVAVSAAG